MLLLFYYFKVAVFSITNFFLFVTFELPCLLK